VHQKSAEEGRYISTQRKKIWEVKKKKMNTKSSKKIISTTIVAAIIVLSAMVALAMPVGASDLNYATESDITPMQWIYGQIECSYDVPAPGPIYTISVPSYPCGADVAITVRDAFWVSDRYQVWVDGVLIGTTPTETCGGSVHSQGTFAVTLTAGAHTLQFKNTCEPCFTGSAPCYNGWLASGFYYMVAISPYQNQPPIAKAGPDQTYEQTYYQGALVPLDGSGSTDDGCLLPLTYTWTWPSGSATGMTPTVSLPLGTTTITLVVNDGIVDSAPDTVTVTVQDTTPPVITCPADVTVEQESAAGTVVPLTATATDICDADPTITNDTLPIYPLGTTTVTFTATDASGNSASCSMTVTVVDTTAPDISVTVSPDTLWPPNHKMVNITATVTVSDICDTVPIVVLTSVTSNEPDNAIGIGDGNTINDIQGAVTGTEDYEFQLRAERAGTGDGRVYTITYTATDASGNSASADATVVVPHDMD
jgi:hypothetical protein